MIKAKPGLAKCGPTRRYKAAILGTFVDHRTEHLCGRSAFLYAGQCEMSTKHSGLLVSTRGAQPVSSLKDVVDMCTTPYTKTYDSSTTASDKALDCMYLPGISGLEDMINKHVRDVITPSVPPESALAFF